MAFRGGGGDAESGRPGRKPRGRTSVILALVCAFVVVLTVGRIGRVDRLADQGWFAKYPVIAAQIIGGEEQTERVADLSPGYLAFVYGLMGPLDCVPLQIRTLQIILLTLAAAACGAAAAIRWGPWPGLASGACLLGSRAALVNATELEPETLILFFSSLGLALLVCARGWRGRACSGLLLGLAAATRPTVVLPVVLIFAALVAFGRRDRGQRLQAAAFAFAAAVPPLVVQAAVAVTLGAAAPAMNPGTVAYESWNPMTSGYQGEAPEIVKDVERALALPDGLHVAYRLVAGRALGTEPTPSVSNGFWSGKAFAFCRHQPGAALGLAVRKAILGLHSYDAWDLATMERKDRDLRAPPMWLPFGLVVAVAGLGWLWGRRQIEAWLLAAWASGAWSVMVLFYVSSRQRNAVLPATALLVGLAVHGMMRRWNRAGIRSLAAALSVVVVLALILGVNGAPQREDHHTWSLRFAQEAAAHGSDRAHSSGDGHGGHAWAVRSALVLDETAGLPSGTEVAVMEELAAGASRERRFDLALVLSRLGRWQAAERLFDDLHRDGYRPWRGARVTSSTAYHRARCQLALGNPVVALKRLEEGPKVGRDARTEALAAVLHLELGEVDEARVLRDRLFAQHDVFTARLALGGAEALAGREEAAAATRRTVLETFPELQP